MLNILIEKIINDFNPEFYYKAKSNGKNKNKHKNKKSNFYNVKKTVTVGTKKKPFRDKNGNFFCYNYDKYSYIIKRHLKPPKKRKNGNNGG